MAGGARAGSLRDPDALAHVDPDAVEEAVLVDGEVDGPDPVPVAISVNGVIGAWADAVDPAGSEDDDALEFRLVVPPSLLHPGGNDVRLYVVEGPEGSPRLAPVELGR